MSRLPEAPAAKPLRNCVIAFVSCFLVLAGFLAFLALSINADKSNIEWFRLVVLISALPLVAGLSFVPLRTLRWRHGRHALAGD